MSGSARPSAAVLGTGDMGGAIARALLASGCRLTVWNRTTSRATPLEALGALVAATPSGAVGRAEVTIMCVRDHEATQRILSMLQEEDVHERTFVQLTSTTPAQARITAEWFAQRSAKYLDGVILNQPSAIGDRATLFMSGDQDGYSAHAHTLARLGRIVYLGAVPQASAQLDAAVLTFLYACFAGFLQGAALADATSIPLDDYVTGAYAILEATIPTAIEDAARQIAADEFGSGDVRLDIGAAPPTGYVLDANHRAGIAADLPEAVARYFNQALERGLAQEQYSAIYKVIRGTAYSTP